MPDRAAPSRRLPALLGGVLLVIAGALPGAGPALAGGATVRDNRTRGNVVGLFALDEPFYDSRQEWYVTEDVLFQGNNANDNLDVSCEDETSGSGTQGTANTWIGNLGELDSSSPAGICGGVTPP